MSAICDFYLEMAERGLCPIEDGETLPEGVTTTAADYVTRFGETIQVPCITTMQAHAWSRRPDCPEAVRAFLKDFDVEILEGRTARGIAATAARLAGEIVAAVTAGEELPEDWHRYDTYADIGEPYACEVVRLVREELDGTGIRP
jgi:hypothetical protein